MKTDHYISLCHEQVAQSPLHSRHGAIVVRGGKVFGQGFNDHRRGFDDGIMKNNRAFGKLALPASRHKSKSRMKCKTAGIPSYGEQHLIPDHNSLLMDRMTMADHRKNTPFSMHAEMMAIHSALSKSTATAFRTMWSVEPSFNGPRGSQQCECQFCEEQHIR